MERFITGKARLISSRLFRPYAILLGDRDGITQITNPKYTATLSIPKTDFETLNQITKQIKKAKETNDIKWCKILPNDFINNPLHDKGDSYIITASCKSKPGIVDRQLIPIENEEELYNGCYVRASLLMNCRKAKGG